MSFSIPLALHYTTTGTSGITYTKNHVSHYIAHCDLINAMVPLPTHWHPKDISRHCLDIV